VISSGPYHLLRHPGYTGAELEFLGLGFLYGNWAGVAALAVLPMIGLIYRIRVEEDALDAALGERYRTYASSRKRMIPFVW
jgi:protein-S-isoprenylcysteine O-methyltransferase Ste14